MSLTQVVFIDLRPSDLNYLDFTRYVLNGFNVTKHIFAFFNPKILLVYEMFVHAAQWPIYHA